MQTQPHSFLNRDKIKCMRYIHKQRKEEWRQCSHTGFVQMAFTITVCPKSSLQQPGRERGFTISVPQQAHSPTDVTFPHKGDLWAGSRESYGVELHVVLGGEMRKLLPGVRTLALDKQKRAHEKIPPTAANLHHPESLVLLLDLPHLLEVDKKRRWKPASASVSAPLWCHTGQCFRVLCFCTHFLRDEASYRGKDWIIFFLAS